MLSALHKMSTFQDFRRALHSFNARIPTEFKPSGIPELDDLLGGGFPCGSLVELCGPACSGRTSLGLSLLAQATTRQEVCALVDVSDSLDPISAAAAGVDLKRLLWIRCSAEENSSLRLAPSPDTERRSKSAARDFHPFEFKGKHQCHGWRHPREQIRGVEIAIPSLISAQPASSRNAHIHVGAKCAGEHIGSRLSLACRRENVLQLSARNYPSAHTGKYSSRTKPWKQLEQAIQSTDLLLHAGGWGIVVFDFGNISWVDARRIELSTWFRFQRAVESTPTILVLLDEDTCAKSCASLVLHCRRRMENWNHASSSNDASDNATFEGFEIEGEVLRSRTGLQPGDSARWITRTVCAASL